MTPFRVAAMSLVVVVVTFAAAALAQSVTIQFGTWAFPGPLLDATEVAVKRFEELHPHIKVEIVSVPFDQTLEKYQVQMAAGTAPDVVEIPYFYLSHFASLGFLYSLDDYIAKDRVEVDPDDIFPPAWDAVTYNGTRYGLPFDLSAQWMAFRPELFAQAGLADPHALYEAGEWTWETLRDVARKLTIRADSGTVTQAGMIIQYNELLGQPWLYQTGSSPFTEDLKASRLSDPQVMAALEFLWSMAIEDGTLFEAWSMTAADPGLGTFGVWPQWLSIPYYFKNSSFKVDIVPFVRGPVDVTTAHVHSLSIWANTEHLDEVWEFVKFYTGEGSVGHVAAGIPPVRRSLFPAYVDMVHRELGVDGLRYVQEDIARTKVYQVTADWGRVQQAIYGGLAPVWKNEDDLTTAVTRIDEEVRAILQ